MNIFRQSDAFHLILSDLEICFYEFWFACAYKFEIQMDVKLALRYYQYVWSRRVKLNSRGFDKQLYSNWKPFTREMNIFFFILLSVNFVLGSVKNEEV